MDAYAYAMSAWRIRFPAQLTWTTGEPLFDA